MKKFIAAVFTIVFILGSVIILIMNTSSCTMKRKHMQSKIYGLDRVATIYNVNGDVVKTYDGKIRIEQDNGDETRFLVGNRSIYTSGGIVVIEESE